MVTPIVGTVVLVRFPFSDLTASKLRPAVVMADADRGDWILCQITSQNYSDPKAITLSNSDFTQGSLSKTSYVRPAKLFTANTGIFVKNLGSLSRNKVYEIKKAVISIFS